MKTYYNILNIPRDTSLKEAKSAYIKLVKQYHPDFNNGSKESERKIKEINNAFQQFKDNYTPTNNQKQEEFRYQSYTDDLMVFFFNKDFEGTVRCFEDYEKELSEDSYSLYIYIISLDKIGETSRAINIFNKYESTINKDGSYINQYLSILNRSENYRETEIIFNKYESMLTKNPFSITKYIYALSRLEKYKELWNIFKKYESILSTHDFAISKYINALKKLGEYKGLIHVYEKYEESVYLNEYAISDYIYALRKTENYTRIIEVLQDYRYVSCLRNNRFLTSTYLYALKVKKEYTLIWETFEEYQSILKGDRYAIYYYLSALSKIATDVSYAKLIIAFEKYKKIVDNIFCIREYFIALNKSDTLDHYKKVRKLYENDYSTLLKTDNFCTRCYVYACEQIRGFENT